MDEQEMSSLHWEDRQKMTELVNDMMFIHASRVIEVNENIKKLNFEVVKSEQTVMIETQKIKLQFQQKLQKIQ
jgi:cilia- and flagella-associated protein 57